VQAVRGLSFTVDEGEVFGLLGPNGAGKTTTVEILEGLRNPDSGTVRVCGFDPQVSSRELKHEIGASLQATSLPDKLRVMEALRLFAGFYKRRRNPEELLKRFGLEEKRNTYYSKLFWRTKAALGPRHGSGKRSTRTFPGRTHGRAWTRKCAAKSTTFIEELRREKKTILNDHALH